MELKEEDIDILDRYYRNELTEKERVILQSRMKEKDFADVAISYLKTIEIVKELGRNELRSILTSVKNEIESAKEFEEYKPSKTGNGFGTGGIISAIIIVIIAFVAWMFFSGKLNSEKIQNSFPDSELVDTVYHYKVQRDTIVSNKTRSEKGDTIIHIHSDTVFVREQIMPSKSKRDLIISSKPRSENNDTKVRNHSDTVSVRELIVPSRNRGALFKANGKAIPIRDSINYFIK